MKTAFELAAEFRNDEGKGASRRLRRLGKVPAILYGSKVDPRPLTLDHTKLKLLLDNERFFSTIIALKVGDATHTAILRDVQRHPWKNQVVHADFQRVQDDEKIRLRIPLHFKNAEISPGVKTEGGMMSHLSNDLHITCLPKDLPEYIEIDVSGLHLNQSLKVSDLKLPAGVEAVDLLQGRDHAVVAVHSLRAEEPEAAPVAAAAAAAPAAEAAAAKPEAAKPEAKKEGGKK
jgi:large subunit ribosomal protein L25